MLHSELLGMAQVKIKEAIECVALATGQAADATVGDERLNYAGRAIVNLNDAYALTRSAVNGNVPALLERQSKEGIAAAIAKTVDCVLAK